MATYKPVQWIAYDPGTSSNSTTGIAVWKKWVHQGTATVDNTWYYNTTAASTTSYTIPASSITATNIVWDEWRDVGYTMPEWQNAVWENWQRDDADLARYRAQLDELQAQREQRSRERLAAEQKAMENQIVAHARALDLFDTLLSETERAEREADQRITITGSDGHLYWLETHRNTVHGNIVRVDEHGCVLGRACVAPGMRGEVGALPTGDGWVGQYLGLKFDAAGFLAHANWSSVRTCQIDRAAA